MQLNTIELYKNTPFTTFNKVLNFSSNEKRDQAFDSGRWEKKTWKKSFNMVRDRLTVQLSGALESFRGFNYGSFRDVRSGVRYFFYAVQFRYVNDNTTEVVMVIDTFMTFAQGKRLAGITNVQISRQHLPSGQYEERLQYLRTNDDIIKTTTKRYVFQKSHTFKDFYVIFQCSNDLSKEWGTEDKPKFNMASGSQFDKLTSPVNLYVVEYAHFNEVMKIISGASWVAQNISQVLLVPKDLMQTAPLVNSNLNGKTNAYLKTLRNGGTSGNGGIDFKLTNEELASHAGIDLTNEPHLYRSEYVTIEGYDYAGQALTFDPAFINDLNGLTFKVFTSIGYHNQLAIYPYGYRTEGEAIDGQFQTGTFLNNAFIYNNWNELPILIDNYKLSLAKSANVRQLAEDRQFSGRVKNILDPKGFSSLEGIAGKFNDAYQLTGGGLSLTSIMGKMSDEYEFYRSQRAEFADLKLSSPTITSQTNGETFQIANDIFGFVIKESAPTKYELDKVRRYYNTFGFEFNETGTIFNPESMTICNFLQFKGAWKLNNVPSDLMEQMRSLFELGVQIWHDDGSENPFEQNILNNRRR